jgi:hypothetical protein
MSYVHMYIIGEIDRNLVIREIIEICNFSGEVDDDSQDICSDKLVISSHAIVFVYCQKVATT